LIYMEIIMLDGKIENFINSLDKITFGKVFNIIDLLEDFGYQLRMPYCKKISKNIFELRIRGKIEVRLFYIFNKGNAIIVHGFVKKTEKIPKHELKTTLNKIKKLDLT